MLLDENQIFQISIFFDKTSSPEKSSLYIMSAIRLDTFTNVLTNILTTLRSVNTFQRPMGYKPPQRILIPHPGCKNLAWIKGLTHKLVFHNDRKAKPTKRGLLKKETTNHLNIFSPK